MQAGCHLPHPDAFLDKAVEALRDAPLSSAIHTLMIAQAVRLHAGDDEEARAAFWSESLRQWRRGALFEGVTGLLDLTHLGLAAVWGAELRDAQEVVNLLEGHAPQAPLASTAAHWLSGLIAERRGDGEASLTLLIKASRADLVDLPLYHAHIHADLARGADLAGQFSESQAAQREALEIHRSLGAEPYVHRLEPVAGTLNSPTHEAGSGHGRDERYSDRERDVLTLVLAGMSYEQIGKELYISRSTVGYHLSNLYAKTGVRTRHELAAEGRADPGRFGLNT